MAEFKWWAVPTLHFLRSISNRRTLLFSMIDTNRFRDTRETLSQFRDEYLVVCPQCSNCARVAPLDIDRQNYCAPHRITCQSCSYNKDEDVQSTGIELTLWLQIEVSDRLLWFHNFRHLQYIEAFVSATLRERRADNGTGWRNSSLINRLPDWIKSAKNRKHILKAIDRIKQK